MSYGSNYGYGATPNFVSPYLFAPGSQPVYGGSGSHVILVSRSEEDDPVYIPSYMRPSEGPSLAEQAAALKAARKPAVLTWSNQGTVGTPVP